MYLEYLSHPHPFLYVRNLPSYCHHIALCVSSVTLAEHLYWYPIAIQPHCGARRSSTEHEHAPGKPVRISEIEREKCKKHEGEHEKSPVEHVVYRASLYYTTRGEGRTVGLQYQRQGINIVAGVHAQSASTSLKKPQRQPPERIGSVRLSSKFPRSAIRTHARNPSAPLYPSHKKSTHQELP